VIVPSVWAEDRTIAARLTLMSGGGLVKPAGLAGRAADVKPNANDP
jgi:hypothetical protein